MEEVLDQVDQRSLAMASVVVGQEKAASRTPFDSVQNMPLADVWGSASLYQAKEQYNHYRGRPYAPAKLKAQRIAGQPLRVARKSKSKGKREAGTKTVLDVLRNVGGFRQEADRVAAMLQFLPEAVKMAPDGYTLIDDHEIVLAVRNPNPTMGEGKLIENTVLSLEMTGKGFQHIQKLSSPDSEGRRFRIWYYPASWVSAIHKPELFAAWKVQVDGGISKMEISAGEMAYFHYSDPGDPLGALGPLQAMAADVVTDEAISETQRNAFINAVWPSLLFKMAQNPAMKSIGGLGVQQMGRPILTAEQRREVTLWIKQMFRGWKKAGEPMIIDGMFEDVTPVYNNIREMDFLKSAGLKEAQINKGFTTNPISMGGVESANRATASMAEDHLVGNSLNPVIRNINSVIATKYPAVMSPGESLVCWIEPCRPNDREMELMDKKVRLASGTRLFNEWRKEQGDEEIDKMKDVLVTPQGLMTIDMVLAGADSSGSIPQTDPNAVPNDPVNAQTGKSVKKTIGAKSTRVRTIIKDAFGDVEKLIDEEF